MSGKSTKHWIILILLAGSALTAGAAWLLHFSEQEQLRNRFVKDVSDRASVFARELNTSLESLYTLRTLFIAQAIPREDDFHFVADNSRLRHKDLIGLYWVPEISAGKRERFEADLVSNSRFREYEVQELSGQGQLVPSQRTDGLHRPVAFYNGSMPQQLPSGMDLRNNPVLEQLLNNARVSQQLVLSSHSRGLDLPVSDVDIRSGHSSIVHAALAIPLRDYPGYVAGYVVGVIDLKVSFEDALNQLRVAGIDMKLWDQTGEQEPMLLHHHTSRTRLETDDSRSLVTPLYSVGNRQWFLEAIPTHYYFDSKKTWLVHLVVLLGICVTGLFLYLFTQVANKNARIQRESRQLMTSNQELAEISRTDALTGVANRRYFNEVLDKEWKRSLRNRTPLTLIMVDVDCFKLYNDYYGHLEGDECIHLVAQTLKDMMSRPMDLVARYGGEEFAILLPDTNENAIILAEQCRKVIQQQRVPHASSTVSPYVTISLGMATLVPENHLEVSELIRLADRALYRAKEGGRNQVVYNEGEDLIPDSLLPDADASAGQDMDFSALHRAADPAPAHKES